MKIHAQALGLLGAVLLSAPALAANSASGTLSQFSFRLDDLDKTDAVAPTLNFTPAATGGYTAGKSSIDAAALDFKISNWPPELASGTPPQQTAVTATIGQTTTSASFGGFKVDPTTGAFLGLSDMAVSGVASGLGHYEGKVTASTENYTSAPYTPQLVLSAHTAVTFSALAQVQAQTGGGTADENVWATLSWSLAPQYPSQGNTVYDGVSVFLYGPDAGTLADSRLMTMTFENTSNQSILLKFNSTFTASGNSTVAAVPEPEAYAMMLLGLGVLGGVARRRASSSSSHCLRANPPA